MLIGDVMKATGLTRKALHYYEDIGLVSPAVAENGYRLYSMDDVATLRTIAALRQIDMPLPLVDEYIKHPARAKCILNSYRIQLEGQREALSCSTALLDEMQSRLSQGRPLAVVSGPVQKLGSMLRGAFPGAFGHMLAVHFLPFMDAMADTPEKQTALTDMMEFLDGLEIQLPELQPFSTQNDVSALQKAYWQGIKDLLALPDDEKVKAVAALKAQKKQREDALAGVLPDVYRELQAKAGSFSSLLGASGYYEHVVPNLCILSPEYDQYIKEMERLQKLMDAHQ